MVGTRYRSSTLCHIWPREEEVLDYYVRELECIGGESVGLWRGSMVLAISDDQILADKFSFKTILTFREKGGVTPGVPLGALTSIPLPGGTIRLRPGTNGPTLGGCLSS